MQGAKNYGGNSDMKHIDIFDLKPGDIAMIPGTGYSAEGPIMKSIVKGNTQIHHKTRTPHNKSGKYRLKISETVMCSNLNYSEYVSDKSGETNINMKTFVDVHGNFATLDADGEHTKDPLGERLVAATEIMDQSYATGLDEDPVSKKLVLGALGFGKDLQNHLDQPTIKLVDPAARQGNIDDESDPNHGQVDESKSPVICLGFMVGVPKSFSVDNMMATSTHAIFSKIFDHRKGLTKIPLRRFEAVKEFIYTAGDSKKYGRSQFRIEASFLLYEPSYYFNSSTKRGHLQFKIAEMHIFALDYPPARNTMSDQSFALIKQIQQRSANRFVKRTEAPTPVVEDVTEENPPVSSGQTTPPLSTEEKDVKEAVSVPKRKGDSTEDKGVEEGIVPKKPRFSNNDVEMPSFAVYDAYMQ